MVHAWAPSSRDLAALRHGHGRLRFGWRRKSSEASDVSHGGMIRRARWAIATVFFVNGLVIASWVPHIPAIKGRHALGDGELGLVLLAMAAGSVLSLPAAGWLVGRLGSRAMTTTAGVALCLVLPLPVLSGSVSLLSVERLYRHAIMSSFHAFFSLGGAVGAALAGVAMWLGIGDTAHVWGASGVSVVAVIAAARWLLPAGAEADRSAAIFGWPTRAVLFLGLLAFAGLLAEGAMADWSAVYLHDSLAASPAVAATGFAAFSLAMTVGRLAGDRIVGRLGAGPALRVSGAVAGAGLGAALLIDAPPAAIAGFALVGLGISNIIPVLFSSAGRVGEVAAGPALAAIATPGYLGFLSGPPLIGLAAEHVSLRAALGIVCAACALVAVGARRLPAVTSQRGVHRPL